MNELDNEWTEEWIKERIIGWIDNFKKLRKNELICEWMNE